MSFAGSAARSPKVHPQRLAGFTQRGVCHLRTHKFCSTLEGGFRRKNFVPVRTRSGRGDSSAGAKRADERAMEPRLPPRDPDPDPAGFPPATEPTPDKPDPDVYPAVDPDGPAPQRMRASRVLVLAMIAVILPACQTRQQRDAERERERRDANSAAYKAGEAARRMATEAEKASAEAARKLDESARKAREGWREQERKDRDRTDH